MAPRLVAFDESKQSRHGVLSVGGIVIELDALVDLESRWEAARAAAGIADGAPIKYSMRWPGGPDQRRQMIAAIADLPIQALVALLEDFRPLGMKMRRDTRKDSYIQCKAFEYCLQRLAGDLYIANGDAGPHLVMIDGRDDFSKFETVYREGFAHGWPDLPRYPMPPLEQRGFSQSLGALSNGPVHEIADLVVSCVTRWADERCMAEKGGKAPDREELDQCLVDLRGLFPTADHGIPARRCGHSIVVHAANLTGKEVLKAKLDRWLHVLTAIPPFDLSKGTDIPF